MAGIEVRGDEESLAGCLRGARVLSTFRMVPFVHVGRKQRTPYLVTPIAIC